jgi:hypothetical protein
MLLKNKHRSVYSRAVHGDVIAISDHNGGKSVTNDAENVIADLAPDFDLSRYRVIYKDTRGIWDQMLVDRTGHFAGFSSINERDLPAALAKLTGIDQSHHWKSSNSNAAGDSMTPLKKAVTRRSEELMRDRSKFRRIVVTLYPAGFIGLRLEKCRHEETLSIRAAYETAAQTRVMRMQAERRKGKPCLAKRGRL